MFKEAEIKNLSVSYGKKTILKNIDYTIKSGTMNALLGANGCGKTTLLRAICSFIPSGGDFLINGESVKSLSTKQRAQRISYIPQKSGIEIDISALDVVLMGYNARLSPLSYPSKAQLQRAENALDSLGLSELKQQEYTTLSAGQQQLCILARTLIEDTDLLLLDEPDSALDFRNRNMIMKALKSIIKSNSKAALLCLHDPNLALDYCDNLMLLKDGRICDIITKADSTACIEAKLKKIYGDIVLLSDGNKLAIVPRD